MYICTVTIKPSTLSIPAEMLDLIRPCKSNEVYVEKTIQTHFVGDRRRWIVDTSRSFIIHASRKFPTLIICLYVLCVVLCFGNLLMRMYKYL